MTSLKLEFSNSILDSYYIFEFIVIHFNKNVTQDVLSSLLILPKLQIVTLERPTSRSVGREIVSGQNS